MIFGLERFIAIRSAKFVFVDLDDTLIFTHEANYRSYSEACRIYGFDLKSEDLAIRKGMNAEDFLLQIFPQITVPQIASIREWKNQNYSRYFAYTKVNAPLVSAILKIDKKIGVGLITNAKENVARQLLKFHEVSDLFDFVLCAEEVGRPKPDPMIYFKAVRIAGVESSHCVAIEDSEIGIEAATRARIPTIHVDEASSKI